MDQNSIIDKLKKESDAHKTALQSEINSWVKQSKNIAFKVLLIGGGLALAYLISRQLLGGELRKKKSSSKESGSSIFSTIKRFILQELSVFLLIMAKERLLNYLEETDTDEETNSRNTE